MPNTFRFGQRLESPMPGPLGVAERAAIDWAVMTQLDIK